ncbi:MAG TPA: EamA family transporter [Chitinophagaceae bacterium]
MFQKQLSAVINPLVVNFITYFILSIIAIFFCFKIPWQQLPFECWLYAVLGGITGSVGNAFIVKAMKSGELSVLGPINSYKSVVGIITGVLLLGEIPNIWGLIGVAVIIYGSYFVLDTTEERFTWALFKRKDIQFRIWAMVLTGIEAVFVKKVIIASSVITSSILWCWFGAVFSFLLMVTSKGTRLSSEHRQIDRFLYLVICIGITQVATTYTFAHMHVGYALSLFQLSAIVSVFLGHRIFKEKDVVKKLIGSVIMIVGSAMIILLKGK